MPNLSTLATEARKTIVAVAGILATLVAAGVLPGTVAAAVSSALGILTALGVYRVPNGSSEAPDDGSGGDVGLDDLEAPAQP